MDVKELRTIIDGFQHMKIYRSNNKENLKISVNVRKIFTTHWILQNIKCNHVKSSFKSMRIKIPKMRNDLRVQKGRIHVNKHIHAKMC